MFSGSNKTTRPAGGRITTLIGEDTQITGDIRFSGGLHIDGAIKGNVTAVGDETATLVISEKGSIEGEVRVPHVTLNGTVKGDIYSRERAELASRARVTGDVHYNLIEMAVGAQVNGRLVHAVEGGKMLGFDNGGQS